MIKCKGVGTISIILETREEVFETSAFPIPITKLLLNMRNFGVKYEAINWVAAENFKVLKGLIDPIIPFASKNKAKMILHEFLKTRHDRTLTSLGGNGSVSGSDRL